MGREFSIYLDLIRFSAAFLVLLHHMNMKLIIAEKAPLSGFGNSAVMVFFVLSGYVIAYVTDNKENQLKSYVVNRCGRIYSVVIPALLLTPALDMLGQALAPAVYVGRAPYDFWAVRLVSSFFFMNESWFLSIMSFSNLPYWSLNYEIWYYVLFAVIQFLTGKERIIGIICVALITGPKILLLAPIWWLGVYLYRSKALHAISEETGWILLGASLVLLSMFVYFGIENRLSEWLAGAIGTEASHKLTSSKFFLSHYLLALIISMNFIGFRRIAPKFRGILGACEKPIRFCAEYTFALYLLHLPLILFFLALYQGKPPGYALYGQVILSVVLSVVVIGQFTEKKKSSFRNVFQALYERLEVQVLEKLLRRKSVGAHQA